MTANKRILGVLAIVFFLLLIPFVLMQFTSEVNWSIGDFIVAGGLLLGSGLLIEFVARKVKKSGYKLVLLLSIISLLLLIWIQLAVGIF